MSALDPRVTEFMREAKESGWSADKIAQYAVNLFGPDLGGTASSSSSTGSGSPSTSSKEPVMKVTTEAVRAKALSLMEQHPTMDLAAASSRAEYLLRIEHAEPRITTFDEWQAASFEQQNEHIGMGFEAPLSPLELLFSDPDAFIAQYPDSPDALTITEARRRESLTDDQRAAEDEATALLANLRKVRADMLDAAGNEVYVPSLQALVAQSNVGDGVKKAAEAVFARDKAAADAKAGGGTVADAMADVNDAFAAALGGATDGDE